MAERQPAVRTLGTCLAQGKFMSHYMIFGKDDCTHTQKAIQDYKKQHKSFMYINVDKNPHGLKKLLEYSNDKYIVPVIVNVDEGNVEIGYTGE